MMLTREQIVIQKAESKLPIIVFDMNTKGNLTKVIMGEKIGTKVSS